MSSCTVALNLKLLAPSIYWQYDFEAFAVFDGVPLGCNSSGIFQLETGDSDNLAEIESKLRLATTDFGDNHIKRIRQIVVGYEAAGALTMRLYADECMVGEYTLDSKLTVAYIRGLNQLTAGWPIARYWSAEFENVDGADYALNSIQANLILKNLKFADRSRYGKGAIIFPDFVVGENFSIPDFVIYGTGGSLADLLFPEFVLDAVGA